MVARGSGKGVGELVFNENRISVWEDEKVLEMPNPWWLHNNGEHT